MSRWKKTIGKVEKENKDKIRAVMFMRMQIWEENWERKRLENAEWKPEAEFNANYHWNYLGQALHSWRLQDLPFPKR